MRTAIVLKGPEGTGKGTLQTIISLLYGATNVGHVEQAGIDADFAPDIENKLFVFCNEVMSSSNRSGKIKNKLKPWVTDDEIEFTQKYKNQRTIPNYFNIIFMSNEERPLIVDVTDRRYIVFECNELLPRDLFVRLHDDIIGPGRQVAAFLGHLLRRDVRVKVGEIFDTEERAEIKMSSMSSDQRFIEDIFREGWLPVVQPLADGVAGSGALQPLFHLHNSKPVVLADTIKRAYQLYCDVNSLECRSGDTLLKNLKKAIDHHSHISPKESQVRPHIGKTQVRAYLGIPLVVEDPPKDTAPGARAPSEAAQSGSFSPQPK